MLLIEMYKVISKDGTCKYLFVCREKGWEQFALNLNSLIKTLKDLLGLLRDINRQQIFVECPENVILYKGITQEIFFSVEQMSGEEKQKIALSFLE